VHDATSVLPTVHELVLHDLRGKTVRELKEMVDEELRTLQQIDGRNELTLPRGEGQPRLRGSQRQPPNASLTIAKKHLSPGLRIPSQGPLAETSRLSKPKC